MSPAFTARKIPHADASPPERFFLHFIYGPHPRVQRAADLSELSLQTTLFSNRELRDPALVLGSFPVRRRSVLRGGSGLVAPCPARRLRDPIRAGGGRPALARIHADDRIQAPLRRGCSAERGFLAGGPTSSAVCGAWHSGMPGKSWRGSSALVKDARSRTPPCASSGVPGCSARVHITGGFRSGSSSAVRFFPPIASMRRGANGC
jgi:hypothetical protein